MALLRSRWREIQVGEPTKRGSRLLSVRHLQHGQGWYVLVYGGYGGWLAVDFLLVFLHQTEFRFTDVMGILATPPKATPPRNKALLRDY